MNAIMPTESSFRVMCWRTDMVILLSRGVSISEACRTLGVSRAAYYRHVDKSPSFRMQVERARLSIDAEMTLAVVHAGKEDWRAAAWYLEKRNPRDWGSVKDRLRLAKCTCGASRRVD